VQTNKPGTFLTMEFRDYYEIMGVARDATQDDVKRAYRKLARKYHPDVSEDKDAEARFKEVGEAYEVLKDPEKRAAYDQLGANWKTGQEFRPPPNWDEGFEFSGNGAKGFGGGAGFGGQQFSDFFETLFGQGRTRGGRPGDLGSGTEFHMRGEDRHARVHIDFRDGQKIRLAGQGSPGFGQGKAGDLFLEIEFRADQRYCVDGTDVTLSLPVAPWEAALGATITVPIPSGNVELKIPADSGQDSKLRLKGKGLPARPPGDLYVLLDVQLPPADSDAPRALYEKMSQEMPLNPRADL
jgi:curved DNA-binding protein